MTGEKMILWGAVALVAVLFVRKRMAREAQGGMMYVGGQPGCVSCVGQVL